MAEEPENVVAVAVRKRGQVSGLVSRGYMPRRGRLGGGDRDQHRGGTQDQRRSAAEAQSPTDLKTLPLLSGTGPYGKPLSPLGLASEACSR